MSLGFVADESSTDSAAGTLRLGVRRAGYLTVPDEVTFTGVLRLMKPHYLDRSGQACYIVINPGGAYFPERYELDIAVAQGASLLLATQSATRIHRSEGGPSLQQLNIVLEPGARLEYVPDSVIAYHDAQYQQFTTISLVPEATLFIGEILTPGWHPQGLRFTYSDIHLRTALRHPEHGMICCDNLRLQPEALGPDMSGIGYLEGKSHLGSITIAGPHVSGDYADLIREQILEHSSRPAGVHAGVTCGQRHGVSWLVVRALADSTDELRALWQAINTVDRQHTTGQAAMDLRRY